MKIAIFFQGMSLIYHKKCYRSKASIFQMLAHFPDYFNVDLICPVINNEGEGHLVDLSRINVLPITGWDDGKDLYLRKFWKVGYEIKKIIKKNASTWDLVFIIDPDPLSQFFYLMCQIYGLPRVIYLRGDDAYEVIHRNQTGPRNALAKFWKWWLGMSIPQMLKSSIGVVTGRSLYKQYRNATKNLILFYSSSITKDHLKNISRTTSDTESQSLRLLMVGYLVKYKGFDLAIRTMQNLKKNQIDCSLDIVGTGPEENNLKLLARELGVETLITFSGFIPWGDELFKHYINADVLLQPSKSEGTPKVLPEALSYGLPVVASNIGGMPDIISHERNGFLLKNINEEELEDVIRRIAASEKLLRSLKKKAAESAHDFTIEAQLGKLSVEIKKILCSNSR